MANTSALPPIDRLSAIAQLEERRQKTLQRYEEKYEKDCAEINHNYQGQINKLALTPAEVVQLLQLTDDPQALQHFVRSPHSYTMAQHLHSYVEESSDQLSTLEGTPARCSDRTTALCLLCATTAKETREALTSNGSIDHTLFNLAMDLAPRAQHPLYCATKAHLEQLYDTYLPTITDLASNQSGMLRDTLTQTDITTYDPAASLLHTKACIYATAYDYYQYRTSLATSSCLYIQALQGAQQHATALPDIYHDTLQGLTQSILSTGKSAIASPASSPQLDQVERRLRDLSRFCIDTGRQLNEAPNHRQLATPFTLIGLQLSLQDEDRSTFNILTEDRVLENLCQTQPQAVKQAHQQGYVSDTYYNKFVASHLRLGTLNRLKTILRLATPAQLNQSSAWQSAVH